MKQLLCGQRDFVCLCVCVCVCKFEWTSQIRETEIELGIAFCRSSLRLKYNSELLERGRAPVTDSLDAKGVGAERDAKPA